MSKPKGPKGKPSPLLTFDEAVGYLRMGRSTLFRRVADGEIPTVRIGRSTRFLAEDLDAYLRDHRTTAKKEKK